ncbi:hypothetical protein ACP4OV_029325 [Aristida adscensionis]
MSGEVKTLRPNDLRAAIENKDSKLVVLEFVAPWFDPCKFLEPQVAELAREMKDRVDFYKLDFDECKTLANTNDVRAPATFLVLHNKIKKATVIPTGKADLQYAIDDAGTKSNLWTKKN